MDMDVKSIFDKMLYFCSKDFNVMETINKKQERMMRITRMVSQLSAQEQTELLRRLEQKIMSEKAQKLAGSIIKNRLTMSEIVEEVRKTRGER